MDILAQLIVSGIAVGGIYALIALGFVLIYKATSIINFATGEFMMIGAYFFYTFMVMAGLPAVLSFVLVMFCAAGLGFLVERTILRHMLGQPIISIIMVTIGLSSILMGLAEIFWSSDFKSFPPLFPRAPIVIGDIIVRSNLFWGFIIAMMAIAFFAVLFKYAKVGVAMRATAADQMASFSMGINVRSMFTLAWAFGAMAASLGGVIIGNIGGIQPTLGHIGLKIFPVVILGGLDSIAGAVVGGFIVGLVENLAGGYLDPYVGGGVKDVAPFVVLVIILMVKPYGLFGKKEIERL
ncbi:MAG: branched-chain amino acid ABC transporter permease [Thermodesulfobacteriota bacterium]|nr:branched-chain amino acid ABC transporter permease [Thermodesulfobacteriota bacterium]